MLHDRKNQQLKVGDEIWLPCRIVGVMDQAPYSFLRITPLENAHAIPGTYKELFFVEACQTEKVTNVSATEQATEAATTGTSKR